VWADSSWAIRILVALVLADSYRACVGRFVFTLNRLPSRIPAKIWPTDPSAGRARPLRRIGQNTCAAMETELHGNVYRPQLPMWREFDGVVRAAT
jgi:hypothetical protein